LYIKQLSEMAKDTSIDKCIFWHDFVSNDKLYQFYSAADVGVWPLQETITTLEASSCSLPVIIRDSLSMRDRIAYDNGFACNGTAEDLVAHMEKLIASAELRRQMGRNGRKLVEKEMNWELIAKRYTEVYAESLKR